MYTARGGPSRSAPGAVLACRVPDPPPPKAGPALPGELLAELLSLVGEINSVLDPDALFPTIARCVRRIVDYRILEIVLPDEDGFLVPAFVDGYDLDAAVRGRVKVGEGISGSAAVSREPVFVPDVSQDPRYVPVFPGVVAELAIPLVHQDRLVGVLNIEGPDVEAFTPAARTALQVLAGHLAVAIENATLYRETRWYAGLLETLNEIGQETASILDLDELLQRVAEIVKSVVDYEMFGILLLDEDRQELVLRQAVNFGPGKERSRLPVSEGLCGAAVRSQKPVLVGDVGTDPRYVSLVEETRSELVVPLIHKDRVIGVFDLESPELDRFNERHVKVLLPLASQVAGAIVNARLYDEIRRNEVRLHRELRIARDIQQALFPEASRGGARVGGLGPLPPRPGAGGRPLRLLRHGPRAPGGGHRGRLRQGGAGRPLRRLHLGHRAAAGLRGPRPRGPPGSGQRHPAAAGDRGALLHPGLRAVRLPGPPGPGGQLRAALPPALQGGDRPGGAPGGLGAAARHLRQRRVRRAPASSWAPGTPSSSSATG